MACGWARKLWCGEGVETVSTVGPLLDKACEYLKIFELVARAHRVLIVVDDWFIIND